MSTHRDVYLHIEDEAGRCMCNSGGGVGLKKINVPVTIAENILILDLTQYGAKPELPLADEIVAVRVHIRGASVSVFPIYKDPIKTASVRACPEAGYIGYLAK